MTDLINIAKENGALPLPVSRNEQQYIFTEAQLQATVEQVCKPLVDALDIVDKNLDGMKTSDLNIELGLAISIVIDKALNGHRKLMGQDK